MKKFVLANTDPGVRPTHTRLAPLRVTLPNVFFFLKKISAEFRMFSCQVTEIFLELSFDLCYYDKFLILEGMRLFCGQSKLKQKCYHARCKLKIYQPDMTACTSCKKKLV